MSVETKVTIKEKKEINVLKLRVVQTLYVSFLNSCLLNWYQDIKFFSIKFGVRESRHCQSDPGFSSVIDRVEPLKEIYAQDEVYSRCTQIGPKVANNQINPIGSTVYITVLTTRPDLSVRC